MSNLMQLILWRTFLKLKQYSVWSGQHARLISIRLNMFGTHSNDALLQNQVLLLLSKTWRQHFFKSGTVFLKIWWITSSDPCQKVCGSLSSSGEPHAILNILYHFQITSFLPFTCKQIIALKHHIMVFLPFQRIKDPIQLFLLFF